MVRRVDSWPPVLGIRPRFATHTAQRDRCRVLTVISSRVLNLASRNLGDHDGAGVYVGGAALAFWSSGHSYDRNKDFKFIGSGSPPSIAMAVAAIFIPVSTWFLFSEK